MSHIDTISGDLEAMSTGLGRAHDVAAAADNAAVQIAQRAAGSGFAGIAQNMGRLREAIRDIRAGAAAVAETVIQAHASLAAASKQPSPGETIAVLAPVMESLSTIDGRIGAVVETVTKAKQLVAAILHGGQPGPMLALLDAIRDVLVAVAHRGTAAKQHVETALAEVRKTGDAGN